MKYLCTFLLFLSTCVFAQDYKVTASGMDSYVLVIDGAVVRAPNGKAYGSQLNATVAAIEYLGRCGECEVIVRSADVKLTSKKVSSASSSSVKSSTSISSSSLPAIEPVKLSMGNPTVCEDKQALPYADIERYEAIVVSNGVTRYIQIPKSHDPVIADIGIVLPADTVKVATVAKECGGDRVIYSEWAVVQ